MNAAVSVPRLAMLVSIIVAGSMQVSGLTAEAGPPNARDALQVALDRIVSSSNGPPGAIAMVQHGHSVLAVTAGVAEVGGAALPSVSDHIRVASVAKAFSGAAALALVAKHTLSLRDPIEKWLPSLPRAWAGVTLDELLHHTSGIPDFSACPSFQKAVAAAPLNPPPPEQLLTYVETPPCYNPEKPLEFTPGTKYEYSNSDNVIVGLMIEAVTHETYSTALSQIVSQPLGLSETTLPSVAVMPTPYLHGYAPDPPQAPEDVTELISAGWSWASGGVVSTPSDANRFVRAYVRGELTNIATRAKQFRFVNGSSEPPGPGTNAAGLAIFRYQTACGTVFGHTGNTFGYTQFVAASANGSNSVSITVTGQITPKTDQALFTQLRRIFKLGVCTAMRG